MKTKDHVGEMEGGGKPPFTPRRMRWERILQQRKAERRQIIENIIKLKNMKRIDVGLTETTLSVNQTMEGESIEDKVRRIVSNKEPIKDGAPIIYTDRKDGVQPDYDVRTDRWETAIDAMDKVAGAKIAKRMAVVKDTEAKNDDGKAEPTQTNTGT